MYGFVNRAIEDLVVSRFGEATWEQIKATAGLDLDGFLSLEVYDDSLTTRLIDAASETLGLPKSAILEAFGEHWILYTAREGYGPLLNVAGKTLPEFLQQLDTLHARVRVAMPKCRMPQFSCAPLDARSLRLKYRSERVGFASLIVGILKGLGKRFGLEVSVAHDVRRGEGADHDEFLVHYACV